ncbi:MAG: diguanylate cyclase [Vampirovibrionales bacterium]|nr:diguanylate cyclase [Vampirovibrionales bacterium]
MNPLSDDSRASEEPEKVPPPSRFGKTSIRFHLNPLSAGRWGLSPNVIQWLWIAGITIFLCLFIFWPSWRSQLKLLELKTLDWRLATSPADALSPWLRGWHASDDIAVVAFDDAALNALSVRYGAWPWPRSVHARLIEALNRLGARAIVIDLLYLGAKDPKDDALLVKTIHDNPNVIMSANLQQDGTLQAPFSGLLAAAQDRMGIVNYYRDDDGVSRRMPLWFDLKVAAGHSADRVFSEKRAPSLAVAVLNHTLPSAKLDLEGSSQWPSDATLWVRWPSAVLHQESSIGSTMYPTVSAKDVLADTHGNRSLEKVVRDKIVFVGVTAVGLFDIKTTPVSSVLPGVYFQASGFDTLRQMALAGVPRLTELPKWLRLLCVLIPAMVAAIGFWLSASVLLGLIWPFAIAGVMLLGSWVAFYREGWIVPVAEPLILLTLLTMLMLVTKLIRRSQDAECSYLLATQDTLTGLYNRRYFDEQLSRAIEQSRRSGRVFSLIMLDVDHFKQINDSFGHLSGDRVLKMIAQTLSPSLRSVDVLARFGGEEFAVILMEASQEQALRVAEKLVEAVASTPMNLPSGLPLVVTISAGVACFNTPEQSADTLIARADLALYNAKAMGRNRVGTV